MQNFEDGITGPKLRLRLVTPDDAEYIHGLRTDSNYNTHLSVVTGTAEDQRRWIERYKTREAAGSEYYFVIERLSDDRSCGLVRLYDIADGQFTWGSWILDANKPHKAALESAMLIYDIGFGQLGLERAVFDVRLDNPHVIAFHTRFGAEETGEDAENRFFAFSAAMFREQRPGYLGVLAEADGSRGTTR